jgi:hypothetical protein
LAAPTPTAVDFRVPAWGAANGQSTWDIGQVKVTASLEGSANALLTWNSTNGLGVDSSVAFPNPNTPDIEYDEFLRVEFSSGLVLSGAWVTNLSLGENGRVEFYSGIHSRRRLFHRR